VTKPFLSAVVVCVFLAATSGQAQTPRIDHQPVACAQAGKFPRLEARFMPVEGVAAARVVFQGQTADWYSVAMKPEAGVYSGVLPKPNKDLKSFRYYIEVTDEALGTRLTSLSRSTSICLRATGWYRVMLQPGSDATNAARAEKPVGVRPRVGRFVKSTFGAR
jgi:hypothetical protein